VPHRVLITARQGGSLHRQLPINIFSSSSFLKENINKAIEVDNAFLLF